MENSYPPKQENVNNATIEAPWANPDPGYRLLGPDEQLPDGVEVYDNGALGGESGWRTWTGPRGENALLCGQILAYRQHASAFRVPIPKTDELGEFKAENVVLTRRVDELLKRNGELEVQLASVRQTNEDLGEKAATRDVANNVLRLEVENVISLFRSMEHNASRIAQAADHRDDKVGAESSQVVWHRAANLLQQVLK